MTNETYRYSIGSGVSNPMNTESFEKSVRSGKIKPSTNIHIQSNDTWVEAKNCQLFNQVKRMMQLEKDKAKRDRVDTKQTQAVQANEQKKAKTNAARHSRAMQASSTNSARSMNRSEIDFWTAKGFSEWVLSAVEQVIFVLFILGLLGVIAWSLFTTGASTVGLFRAMTLEGLYYDAAEIRAIRVSAVWRLLASIAISVGMIIGYLISFIISAAPILALLRIADKTRLTSELLRREKHSN
ncbi:hypothetical protein N9Z38_02600 [Mariniblastus sp.]|nr:hypothetical protein [Mariniblastus sp.]MDB4368397.1 hypothetical protein [Mariniblastus sp.]MDB4396329.1 hypothetical protein [bacterium]